MTAVAFAVLRRPSDGPRANERVANAVISWCAGLTGFIVIGLSVVSFAGQRTTHGGDAPLTVRIIGHQWWWELHYFVEGEAPSFGTANELRIPAGRDVVLKLESADVIHSFGAPNLAGKKDLIPGRVNELKIHAAREGVYRAQCAEFCGLQHAHMGLDVIVENDARFEDSLQTLQIRDDGIELFRRQGKMRHFRARFDALWIGDPSGRCAAGA